MEESANDLSPQKDSGPGSRTDDDFTAKLLESKAMRKKAEEDALLLQNRIKLLQLEEKKAMKKIEETKKKAQEIQELKQRNYEIQLQKEEMARKRQQEFEQKNIQNRLLKERIEQGTMNTRIQYMSKVKEDAEKTKQHIKEAKDLANQNRDETYVKNAVIAQKIRQTKMEAEQKRKLQQEKAKEKAKREYEEKIRRELLLKQETESHISDLERQEMELIERLRNTQSMQKEAFEALENAIATSPKKSK